MSGTLYTYKQFLNEINSSFETEIDAKSRLLKVCAIKANASISERESLEFFINEGFTNELFSLASELNEESYVEKFKNLAQNAQDTLKSKGKEYANKLGNGAKTALQYSGKILAPLKSVINSIGKFLIKAWELIKTSVQSAVEKSREEITTKLKHFVDNVTHSKTLVEEAKNLKAISVHSVKWATGGIIDSLTGAAEKAASTDESVFFEIFEKTFYLAAADVIETDYSFEEILKQLDTIDESHGGIHIPFISSIMNRVAKYPPFSLIHTLEAKIGKAVGKGLNHYSLLATKIANAPGPYEFVEIATLVSIVFGHLIDEKLDIGLEKIAELAEEFFHFAIPGYGLATMLMKYGGIALAVYGIIQKVISEKSKDHEEHQ